MRLPRPSAALLGLALSTSPLAPALAQTAATATAVAPAPTWSGMLTLRADLRRPDAWTAADEAAVGAHFQRLKAGHADGTVVFAGRTPDGAGGEMPADGFGLVVFRASDEAAARAWLAADPAVAAGVMSGRLQPFSVVFGAKR